ncbi:MAG: SIS domain-containing protein [Myxococcales bacterium]|nr:SIS domain-containing protein [Myxococcales bacterium]
MTDLVATARAALADGVRVRHELIATELPAIVAAGELIAATLAAGGKVLLCGNGGSAADAQHIAAELVGRFVVERRALPAIALTTDTSALTAIGNDYGYDVVFSRQVEALGRPGDLLIAITTSGGSRNVVAAVAAARAAGMQVVGLTGARGRDFIATCDAGVAVPSGETARIQECHIAIGHVWCELVDTDHGGARVPASGDGRVTASAKEYGLAELIEFRARCRQSKRAVAWTNGVFDVLHVGHLQSLRAARGFADVLIVGVNSDASVRGNKGPSRPIFPAAERVELLAALECVDAITVFDAATPVDVLTAVRPDVHVKGADYAPPDGKPIPEAELVRSWGGRVEFVPLVPGRSSTDTLARLLAE